MPRQFHDRLIVRFIGTALLIVIAGVIGFGAGRASSPKARADQPTELAEAIPIWIHQSRDPTECLEPTPAEAEVFATAVRALELEADNRPVWLGIGAQQFLSHGLYRSVNRERSPVCAPSEIYARVSHAITASRGFSAYVQEYQLRLAGRLPDPSSYVVEAVAAVAFEEAPHVQREQSLRSLDLRPIARTVLASYGAKAVAYQERALKQMSARDALGTGAAQIAAATRHPEALGRVKSLMDDILASAPKAEGIGLEQRRRLYELAYAMYFAGPEAQKYAAPIQELMQRKVKSRAPPFGLVDLSPKQMCHVLDNIFGEEQSPSRSYEFCADKKYPYPS